MFFEQQELYNKEESSRMDREQMHLTKRHSFPYMKVYTWNILKSGSQNQVEIPLDQADSAPVINSDGTSAEREARLEEAILWIRKELVGIEIKFEFSKFDHFVVIQSEDLKHV